MQARANDCVYWPGQNRDIHRTRDNCKTCTSHSPSQPREPITQSPSPQFPFQMITGDYFVISGHHYLIIIDRFSGWNCLYHFGANEATSTTLINVCRTLFTNYGAPEEFGSDGGPQLTATNFQEFLSDWGVHHRLSSAEYPQSNGRAELGVKAAKRIIYDNVSPNGKIDNNKVARAIMQYRNTPLPDINLSPAQILFHRKLRDHIPTHPSHYELHREWVVSANEREEAFAKKNHTIADKYNKHTKSLPPLPIGTTVLIQNRGKRQPRQWHRTGRIIEVLPNRQYRIRTYGSGRVTLQNRRFIRTATNVNPPSPLPSPLPHAPSHSLTTRSHPSTPCEIPPATGNQPMSPSHTNEGPPEVPSADACTNTATSNTGPPPARLNRLLKRLASHNKPGLLETQELAPRR